MLDELPQEQARDHEPGDDEEHVDADETTGEAQVGVEQHDQEHRERPQPLDVRAAMCPLGGLRHRRDVTGARGCEPGPRATVTMTRRDLGHIDGETLFGLLSHDAVADDRSARAGPQRG